MALEIIVGLLLLASCTVMNNTKCGCCAGAVMSIGRVELTLKCKFIITETIARNVINCKFCDE